MINNMKTSVLIAALAIASVMTSCTSDETRLAKNIQGTWSGASQRIDNGFESTSSYIPIVTFIKDVDRDGGTVTIDAMVSMTSAAQGTDRIMTPITVTAAANATIKGTWRATDDDEIYITLEPGTMVVNIDPSGVVLNENVIDGATESEADSIAPGAVASIKRTMTGMLHRTFLDIHKIDDIKIKNDIMECEIDDKEMSFMRMGSNPQ